MTESEQIYWAAQQFAFALKFVHLCQKERISADLFKPSCDFHIDGVYQCSISDWDAIDQTQLNLAALNQLMIAVGASAIAIDYALTRKHGSSSYKNWHNNPSDLNSLREIIFLIRSAYAHKIPDVYWHIDGPRRNAVYKVQTPDGEVVLDTKNRNGTKFDFSHLGGIQGYLRLLHYADDLLKK